MVTFRELYRQIRELPANDRIELAHVLLQSVDDEVDPEYERLWMEEIERRLRDLAEGRTELIPAEQVFAELRAELDAMEREPEIDENNMTVMPLDEIKVDSLQLPPDERLDLAYFPASGPRDRGFRDRLGKAAGRRDKEGAALSSMNPHEANPGLYLHIPFCSAICPYCDFAVLTGGPERRRRFVEHLLAEIRLWAPESSEFESIDTVYFGGGTPSALTPEDLARILRAARENLSIRDDAWIFFEANPEDVTPENAKAWHELGVRFLSLGIQSFDTGALKFLGRRHSPEQARRSVEIAGAAGFDTVSIDLIYGLPDQPFATWRQSLETAVALAPDHISCYQLTFHDGTPFGRRLARREISELPDEEQAKLFFFTHEFLGDHGHPGYEVSSFSRSPEHRSRHNQKYWRHVPYLGLGPAAHSFSGTRRWWNERTLRPYEVKIDAAEKPLAGSETLSAPDLALEALMLGLRTVEGIDLAAFPKRYGVDLRKRNEPLVERLVRQGLLRAEGTLLAPTLAGLAVADSFARDFVLSEG